MVKFYHVVAFPQRVFSPEYPTSGFYMGKTSDLVFKTEADKSVDLDDGTTEVGSEKLSVSFSILGKLLNSWGLKEVWLIPVCDDYEVRNPEILRIFLVEGDYRLEEKSGEFGKINFTGSLRYPVAAPQYENLTDYFTQYFMVLGVLTGDVEFADFTLFDADSYLLCNCFPEDLPVRGCFAITGLLKNQEYSLSGNDFDCSLDGSETHGVFRLAIDVS